ncbi:MAG TPA: S49 family peptidase, partial [Rhizomicrobium sp.]|nr:S49 family peptidase [Rhizomicrobium sp.]
QQIAKGRVWTAADAKPRGLVDELGTFWNAVDAAKKLGGIGASDSVSFKLYPHPQGFFGAVDSAFSGTMAGIRVMQGMDAVLQMPMARTLLRAMGEIPRSGVEMRASGLPSDE